MARFKANSDPSGILVVYYSWLELPMCLKCTACCMNSFLPMMLIYVLIYVSGFILIRQNSSYCITQQLDMQIMSAALGLPCDSYLFILNSQTFKYFAN